MDQDNLTRKERERLRHKQQILNKALQLFSEKGFHLVSMQQIAEASEFSVGTLYNFFVSKEALFEELLDACGSQTMDRLVPILYGPGAETDRLRNFIRQLPVIIEQNGDVLRLYVSQFGTGAMMTPVRKNPEIRLGLITHLSDLIDSGIKSELFRSVNPTIAATALMATSETLVLELANRFDRVQAQEITLQLERLFVDGLLKSGDERP